MTDLEKKIQAAAQAYYSTGKSELTDGDFDALVEQLRKENPDAELLKQVGWGYSVDGDTTPGEKYPHKYGKAGSLDKARTWKEIPDHYKYSDNGEVDVSAKLDGLSVVLYYTKGRLIQALTRGDGKIGVDITGKIRFLIGGGITDDTFSGAVRGEIIMSVARFKEYQKLHPDAKNPRNTAVGLINSKSVSTDELDFLDVVVYSIVGDENVSRIFIRPISWLNDNFKYAAPRDFVILKESDYLGKLETLRNKWSEIYPIDGVVLTHGVAVDYEKFAIGYDQIAFKFAAESAETEVVDIEWNMSKTRYAIPRVRIKKVNISGTDVDWATGNNAEYITKNGIGIGAVVSVSKHGEIIPQIDEILKPSNPSLKI